MELKPDLFEPENHFADAFNRTTMELKQQDADNIYFLYRPFNRTTMELKQSPSFANLLKTHAFNRTTMELKQAMMLLKKDFFENF